MIVLAKNHVNLLKKIIQKNRWKAMFVFGFFNPLSANPTKADKLLVGIGA